MAVNTDAVNVYSYTAGNVSVGVYTQLIASSKVSCSKLQITDTSGKILILATGAAGSEVDFCQCPVSGIIDVTTYFAPGTRFSIKAVDATATTGYNILGFIG